MKKFVLGFIVAVVLCGAAFSETTSKVDLKAMSDVELVNLKNDVESELALRASGPEGTIYNGTYVVGKDILAGKYEFFFTPKGDSYSNVSVFVFANEQDYAAYGGLTSTAMPVDLKHTNTAGDSFYLDLKDGQVVYILQAGTNSPNYIRKFEANWQP